MSAKTKKTQQKKQTAITEVGIKVGKALARTSAKADEGTQKVKNIAEELINSVAGKHTDSKTKKNALQPRNLPLSPAPGLSVEGHLGFLAGDIYQILKTERETAINKLISTLKKHKHSETMIYAAIGWLAREGQVTFTPNGRNLILR